MIKTGRVSPEFVLLGFLYQGPSYGYELHRKLRDEFGYIWHISQSQTYNILKRLETNKFIGSDPMPQEKLPARQQLHLSDAGTQRFHTWLSQPTNCSVHAIRVEFITRLYFTQLYYPEQTQDIIQKQVDEVTAGLSRLQDLRLYLPSEQTFNRLALDMRIKLLGSIIRWLETCQEEFSNQINKGDHYQ